MRKADDDIQSKYLEDWCSRKSGHESAVHFHKSLVVEDFKILFRHIKMFITVIFSRW